MAPGGYAPPAWSVQAYPGIIGGTLWDAAEQRRHIEAHSGFRYARKHNLPLWIGECGAVFNIPPQMAPDRVRAMDDQLGLFNEYGLHWSVWAYKDVGAMGMVRVKPDSEYLKTLAPFLEKKARIQVDSWMSWVPDNPARRKVRELAEIIVTEADEPDLDAGSAASFLDQMVLSGYAAHVLQPSFARLFRDMSEEKIDQVLRSWKFPACQVNTAYAEVIRARAGQGAG